MSECRIVALGDVGGVGGYHVGDEAMLEAALAELGARGVVRCTVLSADPIDTGGRYGVESIPQFGFAGLTTEIERDARLQQLLADPAQPWAFASDDPALRVRDALTASSAAVITGGGNLDATWPHHVYERAAFVGMARKLGKRVVVTGQGIGPNLDRRCGELVSAMISDADLASVRDRRSLALVAQLGQGASRVHMLVDDAAFLPGHARHELLTSLGLVPGGFVAATFSEHSGVSDPEEFIPQLARLVDVVVKETGLPMVLVPHQGNGGTGADGDVRLHERLARLASSAVHELPVLSARDTVWITGQAAMVVANRYHPIVFGLAAAVPSIGLAVDEYTHRKISGALELAGLGDWCLPSVALGDGVVDAAVAECWGRRQEIVDWLTAQRDESRLVAAAHWDQVAALIKGSSAADSVRAPDFGQLPATGAWALRAAEMQHWANQLARRDAARRREFDDACARLAAQGAALRVSAEERAAALDRIALLERIVDSEQGAAEAARDLAGESLDRVSRLILQKAELTRQLEGLTREVNVAHQQVESANQQVAGLSEHAEELRALHRTRLLRWSSTPRRYYTRIRRGLRLQ